MHQETNASHTEIDQLFQDGLYQEALDAIAANPALAATPHIQHIHALCLTRIGQVQDADRRFVSIIQANPNQVTYKLSHLELLAIPPLQINRLRQRCAEILSQSPGHPVVHYYLGLAEFELDNYEDAVKHFKTALTRFPNHPHYMTLTARAALGTGDIETAITLFKKAHTIDPNRLDTIIFGAEALLINGDNDDAVTWSMKATTLSPNDDDTWFRLGLALLSNQDPNGAAKAFSNALAIKPESVEYTYHVGHAFIEGGRADNAIQFLLSRAKSIQDELMILCLTGSAYQATQSPKIAAQYFEKAHQLYPNSPIPFVHQSALMHNYERYEASLKHANRALTIDDRLAEAHFRKAEALSALAQSMADAAYQTAIGIEPYNPKTYLAYAKHLIRSQNHTGASQVLDTVINMFPKFNDAQILRDTLS